MKKFIIVAGSPSVGKTITTHKVLLKLLDKGYVPSKYLEEKNEDFWLKVGEDGKPKTSGSVVLEKDGKRILVVTHGDIEKYLNPIFDKINFDEYYAIVCCSHATRGKKIFEYFYNLIGKVDLNKTQVIPIHKNFLYGRNEKLENEKTAELIIQLLDI